MHQSFFDLHGGYFDDPALMDEVKRLNSLLDEAKRYACSSVAEILVVSDETSCSYATFESGFLQQTLQPAQVQLAKLGASTSGGSCSQWRIRKPPRWDTLNGVGKLPWR